MHESSDRLEKSSLARHGTLLSTGASPAKHAAELKVALGNANSRLKPGASVQVPSDPTLDFTTERVTLEQARTRARVETDLVLERYTCVQGGYLNGVVKVRVRTRSKGEGRVLVAGGKIRVIGLESIQNDTHRHPFYLQSAALLDAAPLSMDLFDSQPDAEGFSEAKEGVHAFPFSMFLPMQGEVGNSKGTVSVSCGALVRYIVLVSLKVKDRETNRRSIAHFYRECEVWPRLNPSSVLSPAMEPNQDSVSKALFMGGSGKVTLTAATHRVIWIAGQKCPVKIKVINHSRKTLKSVTLTLIRSTVVFKPTDTSSDSDSRPQRDREMTAVEKEVAESTLEMAQRVARGHASAKGWWTGVQADETLEFSHSISIPPDALSIAKSRLLEVTYMIRVGISAGPLTCDLHVSLPITVINFLSVDPPPTFPVLDKNFLNLEDDPECSGLLYAPLTAHRKALEVIVNDGRTNEEPGNLSQTSSLRAPERGVPTHEEPDNISLQEDNDDFVEQAIGAMMADPKYGEHGPRFADLYYESVQEGLADVAGTEDRLSRPGSVFDHDQSLSTVHDSPTSSHSGHSTHPEANTRPRISTFPQRVQQKLEEHKCRQHFDAGEICAQKRPVLVSREMSVESSRLSIQTSRSVDDLSSSSMFRQRSSTFGSYFRPRDEIPDEIERFDGDEEFQSVQFAYRTPPERMSDPELPSQCSNPTLLPAIPDASPSPMSTRNAANDSLNSLTVARTETDFAVAQYHPINPSFRPQNPVAQGSNTRNRIGPRPRAQTLPGTDPRAAFADTRAYSDRPPSLVVTGGGSVKDRIRALEEKARAERDCFEGSGPL
ncbi:hypothetical protein AAF712_004382 [Marasmius tenuissimus]|uniref:Arrestin C-terminal-like domain-containing protein n=1 Tax=Marasmius tenuissimus TaxID=585030 RepID=A0ABR3A470_9AGAR